VVLDASDPAFRARVGTEDAAVLALLDPDVLHRIAPDRAAGLRLTPVDQALPSLVRAARAGGATVVVAVLDVTSDEAFALARRLPEDARPDLVVLAGEGDDVLFARPASVTPAISSPPPGGGVEVLLGRSDEMRAGFEMLAVPLDEEGQHAAAAVDAFVQAIGQPYCDAFGARLPGGHLARELDAAGVADLTAQIVREFAGADVAFLNVSAVETGFRPSDQTGLNASDFYIALEYDEPLQVADVPASWLLEALQRARARHPDAGPRPRGRRARGGAGRGPSHPRPTSRRGREIPRRDDPLPRRGRGRCAPRSPLGQHVAHARAAHGRRRRGALPLPARRRAPCARAAGSA
jgi:hypothetical protein